MLTDWNFGPENVIVVGDVSRFRPAHAQYIRRHYFGGSVRIVWNTSALKQNRHEKLGYQKQAQKPRLSNDLPGYAI